MNKFKIKKFIGKYIIIAIAIIIVIVGSIFIPKATKYKEEHKDEHKEVEIRDEEDILKEEEELEINNRNINIKQLDYSKIENNIKVNTSTKITKDHIVRIPENIKTDVIITDMKIYSDEDMNFNTYEFTVTNYGDDVFKEWIYIYFLNDGGMPIYDNKREYNLDPGESVDMSIKIKEDITNSYDYNAICEEYGMNNGIIEE